MPRLPNTLTEEECDSYRPLIEELLHVHGFKKGAVCNFLRRYGIKIDSRQLEYRLKKWNCRTNLTRFHYTQAQQKRSQEVWTQNNEYLQAKFKRHRWDLPSVPNKAAYSISQQDRKASSAKAALVLYAGSHRTVTNPWHITPQLLMSTEKIREEVGAMLRYAIPPTYAVLGNSETAEIVHELRSQDEMMYQQYRNLQIMITGESQKITYEKFAPDLKNVAGPIVPTYDPMRPWTAFTQAFIDYIVYLSNNGLLRHSMIRAVWRELERYPQSRSLLEWMLESHPGVATEGLSNMLFRRAVNAKSESKTVKLQILMSRWSNENLLKGLNFGLKNGNLWCLNSIVNLYSEPILKTGREQLDIVILSPKVLTFQTVPKICHLMKFHNLDISVLRKYSDTNPDYTGWDIGTKLFLLASKRIRIEEEVIATSYSGNRKKIPKQSFSKHKDLNRADLETYKFDYEKVARYLLENCVKDKQKTFMNAIIPLSYLRRPGRASNYKIRAVNKSEKQGPRLRNFCSYKGIQYILEHGVDINGTWQDEYKQSHHALILALQYQRPKHITHILLIHGADVNVVCGQWDLETPKGILEVPATPLHMALKEMDFVNIELILAQEKLVMDSRLVLYLACRYRHQRLDHDTQKQKKEAYMRIIRTFIRVHNDSLGYMSILEWTKLDQLLGDAEVISIEGPLNQRPSDATVEEIFNAIKSKEPKLFQSLLPAHRSSGDMGARRYALRKLLERLEMQEADGTIDDLICIHEGHKSKGAEAHRPLVIYELWKELLACKLLPSAKIREKLLAPIFWSALWDYNQGRKLRKRKQGIPSGEIIGPQDNMRDNSTRIIHQYIWATADLAQLELPLSREQLLKMISQHAKTQFLSATCQNFEKQHKGCFDKAIYIAIKCKWNIAEETKSIAGKIPTLKEQNRAKMGSPKISRQGLNVLHFAVAISASSSKALIEEGILTKMKIEGKRKLLLLAAYYGRKETIESLVKDCEASKLFVSKLVNHKGSIEDFELLNYSDIPKPIRGNTTALHIATYYGRKDIVNLLLKYGADINMHVFVEFERKIRKQKNQSGAQPKYLGDRATATPLVIAAAEGNSDLIHLLLDRKPIGWRLAAAIAHEKKHTGIARAVESYGLAQPTIEVDSSIDGRSELKI